MTYNNLNQTTGTTNTSGASNQAMTYNSSTQDERLTRGNTSYVNGAMGVMSETNTLTTRYRYDDTGTLLVRQGPGGANDTQYYLRDGLGSIVGMTDHNGNLVANYTYYPYGNTLTATGTKANLNPWRYAAGYTDTNSGLTKFGTRYYNPNHGRWTQPDHWGPDHGYNYAGSDPVNRTDITGRAFWESVADFVDENISDIAGATFGFAVGWRPILGDRHPVVGFGGGACAGGFASTVYDGEESLTDLPLAQFGALRDWLARPFSRRLQQPKDYS